MQNDFSPKKVCKCISQFYDLKKDMTKLQRTRYPSATDNFAEKYARARLVEDKLQSLLYFLDTVPDNNKKVLFLSYSWKLSIYIYRLQPYLNSEEKEKSENACSFLKGMKKTST